MCVSCRWSLHEHYDSDYDGCHHHDGGNYDEGYPAIKTMIIRLVVAVARILTVSLALSLSLRLFITIVIMIMIMLARKLSW